MLIQHIILFIDTSLSETTSAPFSNTSHDIHQTNPHLLSSSFLPCCCCCCCYCCYIDCSGRHQRCMEKSSHTRMHRKQTKTSDCNLLNKQIRHDDERISSTCHFVSSFVILSFHCTWKYYFFSSFI